MMAMWPNQVHTRFAEQDGLTPADFDFMKWPVSNVRMEQPTWNETRHDLMLRYRCDISPDTPQVNQYAADGTPIPDPVGIVLAWLQFQLLDADSHDVLDENLRDHMNGSVIGYLGKVSPLWHRLKPSGILQVKLVATPKFMYVDEDGGGQLGYCTNPDGYFRGDSAVSPIYSLAMTKDGDLLLDGEGPPVEPITAQTIYTPEEAELQAEMAREHEEVERAHREEAARMAKQQREIDAAKEIIYDRRGNYSSDEDWLFAVLADKTLDFGTVRKYVYLVAEEVGFEMEQARKLRQEKRDAEAAQRRKEYEAQQAEQEQADNIEMVQSMLDSSGAETLEAKADLLRKVIKDPRAARYHDAAKAVAASLGITL